MNWYFNLFKKSSTPSKDAAAKNIEMLKTYLSKIINDKMVTMWRNDSSLLRAFRGVTGLLDNLSNTVGMRNDFDAGKELSGKVVMSIYQISQQLTQLSGGKYDFSSHPTVKLIFDTEEQLSQLLDRCKQELSTLQQGQQKWREMAAPHQQPQQQIRQAI